jgi:DNA polymerase
LVLDTAPVGRPAPGARSADAPPPAEAAALSPEARRVALQVLEESVRGCVSCALHSARIQTVFARGNGSSGLCFVGEGPGADEDEQGFPFVGAAGQLLDRMIVAMGLSRDDVYVCNIVKCRPPNNRKPEPSEVEACSGYLKQQLELLSPQVIVALGATAVAGLLGSSEGITRLRGKWKLYRGRIPVMPTFNPAYLLRTPGAKREVWEDLQAVLRQLGRSAPPRKP